MPGGRRGLTHRTGLGSLKPESHSLLVGGIALFLGSFGTLSGGRPGLLRTHIGTLWKWRRAADGRRCSGRRRGRRRRRRRSGPPRRGRCRRWRGRAGALPLFAGFRSLRSCRLRCLFCLRGAEPTEKTQEDGGFQKECNSWSRHAANPPHVTIVLRRCQPCRLSVVSARRTLRLIHDVIQDDDVIRDASRSVERPGRCPPPLSVEHSRGHQQRWKKAIEESDTRSSNPKLPVKNSFPCKQEWC